MHPTPPRQLWPRLACILLLALGYLVPVAASVPTAPAIASVPAAPLDQACNPRPPVTVTVTSAGDGRLLATFTATTNSGVTSNQISELRVTSTDGALVDIPGGRTGASGAFTHQLTPPASIATFYVRRPANSGPATVHLRVVDVCGEWPTFVGGGPTVFPTTTPTTTGAPPTATRTATPTTVKVASVGGALSSLILPTPQPASWSGIGNPSQNNWIGLYRPGSLDSSYVTSQRFLTGQETGQTLFPMPPALEAGQYELRLFETKNTDVRLDISDAFNVLAPTPTPGPSPTPGFADPPVLSPAQSPDTVGDVGRHASLRLDRYRNCGQLVCGPSPARDIPVIAYQDFSNSSLKILRCSNKECSGSQLPVVADNFGDVGRFASLQLDNRIDPNDDKTPKNPYFFPVVSYYESLGPASGRLKILHCLNLNCAGGGHPIRTPDQTSPNVGLYTSLALDNQPSGNPLGNPVVSYYDATYGDLKVLHCGNIFCDTTGPNCAAGHNCIATPDFAGDVGQFTSIALNASGHPVISYYDATNGALKVLRCGNPFCTAPNGCTMANQNCIATVDAVGQVGQHTSIALDQLGNPVVAYYDVINQRLKIAHCNDVVCSSAAITVPDGAPYQGQFSSIALDNEGFAAVSYFDADHGGRLKVLRCATAGCTSDNTVFVPDAGSVGQFTSLHLNALHHPVIAYYAFGTGDLKVQHCSSPACIAAPDASGKPPNDGGGGGPPDFHNVGQYTSLQLDAGAIPVISYRDVFEQDLKIVRCGNTSCSAQGVNCDPGQNCIRRPDPNTVGNNEGHYTSLALDRATNPAIPVVAFHDATLGRLKVARCGDPTCIPGGNTITALDAGVTGLTFTGRGISMVLDSSRRPVASYVNSSAQTTTQGMLRVMHCNTLTCAGTAPTFSSPDPSTTIGFWTSIAVDPATGRPTISYFDTANGGRLKILRCGDANCAPTSGNPINTPDLATGVGKFNSLRLDSSARPVVSYWDETNGRLKVLHCINPECSGTGHSIQVVDTDRVGSFTSLDLDSAGRPVISYHRYRVLADGALDGNLKVVHCGDVNCASGNTIVLADTYGDVGQYTSVALDPATGNPFVSYYDVTNADLRMLRCRLPDCK